MDLTKILHGRIAQAKVMLQTGGKGVPRRNLFVINASDSGIGNWDWNHEPPWYSALPFTIPNDEIAIGSEGKLGSDGRLYRALPDYTTVDVTPKVEGVRYHTFSINATKHKPSIFWHDYEVDVTDQLTSTVVGRQMLLLSGFEPPLTYTPSIEFKWDVSGETLKRYWPYFSPTENYCVKEYLGEADLKNSNVAFYWVAGADDVPVVCNMKIGGATTWAEARFLVKRPSSTLDSTTSRVSPPVAVRSDETGGTLQYGLDISVLGKPGIYMDFTVTTQEDVGGQFGLIQIVESTTRRRQYDDGRRERATLTGGYDGAAGGDTGVPAGYVDEGVITSGFFKDSPGMYVSIPAKNYSLKSASIDDQFTFYLMFQPWQTTGTNIWVTLREVHWSWSAAATKDYEGYWSLDSGYPVLSVDPPSYDSTYQPTWTRMVLPLDWVPEN